MAAKKDQSREETRQVLRYWGNLSWLRLCKQKERDDAEEELNALYELSPSQASGMPHGTDISDSTAKKALSNEKKAARLKAEIERIEDELKEINRQSRMIEDAVAHLPPLECKVIWLKYITFGSHKDGYWRLIAQTVFVSIDHCKKLERQGVDRLSNIIKVE